MKRFLLLLWVASPALGLTHSIISSPFNPGDCVTVDSDGVSLKTTGSACGTGGGGASTLAVTTGTSTGFSRVISSPTAIVNFENTQFGVALKGGATAYATLLSTQSFSSMTVTGQLAFAGNKLPSGKDSGHDRVLYFQDGVANFGDAPGFAMVDNTLFTTLVSSFNPTGAVYNDNLSVLSSSAAAAYRMTAYRAQHVNLRNASGAEIGTNASPVSVALVNQSTSIISGVVGTLSAQQSSVSSTTFSTNSSSFTMNIALYSNVSMEISGAYSGFSAVFEGSVDSFTYATIQGARSDTSVIESGPVLISSTTRIWNVPVAGYQNFRFRTTALTTGNVVVNIIASGDNYTPGVTASQASASNLQASVSINGSSNTVSAAQSGSWTNTVTQATPANLRASVSIDGSSNTVQITGTPTVNAQQSGSWSVTATQATGANLRASVSIDGSSNTVQITGTPTVNAQQSGTWTVQPGNTANTTPWLIKVSTLQILGGDGNPATVGYTSVSTAVPVQVLNTVPVSGSFTASPSTGPILGLAQTVNLPTAVSSNTAIALMTDKFGRAMVSGIPRDQIQRATATISSTTETVIISSGAANVFNDICGMLLANTSNVAVRADVRGAGNGGTISKTWEIPAQDTRGFWPGCQNPFVQLSSASNWTVQLSSAVTDVRVTVQYIPLK